MTAAEYDDLIIDTAAREAVAEDRGRRPRRDTAPDGRYFVVRRDAMTGRFECATIWGGTKAFRAVQDRNTLYMANRRDRAEAYLAALERHLAVRG